MEKKINVRCYLSNTSGHIQKDIKEKSFTADYTPATVDKILGMFADCADTYTSLMTFFMNVDDGKETKRIIHLANILEETLTPMLNLALEVTE